MKKVHCATLHVTVEARGDEIRIANFPKIDGAVNSASAGSLKQDFFLKISLKTR